MRERSMKATNPTGALQATSLCLVLLGSVVSSCASAPRVVPGASSRGHVGAVDVESLARLLVENRSEDLPIRQPPFLMAVSPLTKPSRPSRLACAWSGGSLKSFAYVAIPPRDVNAAPDPEIEWVRVNVNFEQIEELIRFNEQFGSSSASVSEIMPRHRTPTYHVAYLCSSEGRVALMVGYVHDSLSGFGAVVTIERSNGGWRFVEARSIWEA
jgi:hypothetical protein